MTPISFAAWKTSLVIPILRPGKGHIAAMPSCKVPRDAHLTLLSTNFSQQLKINTASDPDTRLHLPSSSSQQTSRQTSTSRNHLTVQCVAIDLTAAFDTVSHDILISKIAGSSLPPAITRWLSCYPRGRQAATNHPHRRLKNPSCHLQCSTIT